MPFPIAGRGVTSVGVLGGEQVIDSHIALIGEMGVGKTTVGHLLATVLDRRFLDSDERIEAEHGRTGAQIASSEGVNSLHVEELSTAESMVATEIPSVIAFASSVVDSEDGRSLLSRCWVVWLSAQEDALAGRRENGDHRRPVTVDQRAHLLERRVASYQDLYDLKIDTSSSTPAAVTERIVKCFKAATR